MKEFSPFFGLYTMYMASFENAIKTLTSCIARDERVANAVIELEVMTTANRARSNDYC